MSYFTRSFCLGLLNAADFSDVLCKNLKMPENTTVRFPVVSGAEPLTSTILSEILRSDSAGKAELAEHPVLN